MPLILSGNVATALGGSYEVANSCRFNDDDSPKLTRTFASSGGNRVSNGTTWSISMWVKRSNLGTVQPLWSRYQSSDYSTIGTFNADNTITFKQVFGGSAVGVLTTHRIFRDVAAWYNIIFVWNTGDGTAGDRMRLFVNGVEETSFSTDTNPDQNLASTWGTAHEMVIGNSESTYFDGYLAEIVYLDGTAVSNANDFGEFDSDSPTIWKPKDVSGLTFGTAGFYLDFEDSGDLGDDESGNGNDWGETNIVAADQATDTCTNSFAVLNGQANRDANQIVLSEGNCLYTAPSGGSDWTSISTTFGVNKGKWWAECNVIHLDAGQTVTGIISEGALHRGTNDDGYGIHTAPGFANQYKGIGYQFEGYLYPGSGGSRSSYGASYAQGDIINIAMNLDDGEVTFYKNGTAASGGAHSFTVGTEFWFFAGGPYAALDQVGWNFGGCPPYSISSGNADENGYGNFEHAPPSGFLALCTKNIAENGG